MPSKIESRLVAGWRSAWKLWSVQLNALGLALVGVAELLQQGIVSLPPALLDKLPHMSTIATVCFVLGLVARLIRQDKKAD